MIIHYKIIFIDFIILENRFRKSFFLYNKILDEKWIEENLLKNP